ncbi:Ig-like domain-containing protein [Mucilaginibacter myungsuensis]|uniref:Ig-like domain-containing protein n=1 Tax=Mucilaginibacter myungsuensis TaxID=649104 RepID=A0A929PUK5_9SPHI|nr:Ig-like domain-containing protein [Mucilaginibacter myungsuensis]MBE9660858.1 Ig-like domain-containing protein [Mucilaginibacter myungsuensis]MDN3600905.1 Ig-like domain-containing protein [Mucilaginibacter myungsuensis]
MKNGILGILILSCALIIGCTKEDGTEVVLKSISFKSDTLKVEAGRSVQLDPVFAPAVFSSIAVDWKSTDTSVASVTSDGYLAAKKTGKAWVSIKDKNSATGGKLCVIVQ